MSLPFIHCNVYLPATQGDNMRIVSAQEVEKLLSWSETVEILKGAMIDVSMGRTQAPLRSMMPVGNNNAMGMMAGAMDTPPVHGIKLLSLYPDNPKLGLSSHQGIMVIFDSKTGTPIAGLEAGALTALRTPAASVLATGILARENSQIHTIIGAGEQGQRHLEAFLACGSAKEIRVWARRPQAADALLKRIGAPSLARVVEDIKDAVTGADIVTCVTASPTPVLKGAWLENGQHVNLVGSSVRNFREIDGEGVSLLRYFVDFRESANAQAGEYLEELEQGRITKDYIVGEIGEVLSGSIQGRTDKNQITGYKSLGVAAQDLSVSWAILQKLGIVSTN
jgi:alanine dehydrogenase